VKEPKKFSQSCKEWQPPLLVAHSLTSEGRERRQREDKQKTEQQQDQQLTGEQNKEEEWNEQKTPGYTKTTKIFLSSRLVRSLSLFFSYRIDTEFH
jgi:hypothetical protein